MERYSRKKRVLLISVSLLLILAILAILLVTARCTRDDGTGTTTTGTPGTAAAIPGPSAALAAKDSTAVIVAPGDIDLRSNFNSLTEDRPSAYPNCVGSVLLYVASGPGKPATETMYRPAYADVRVSNYSGKTNLPGTLTVSYRSLKTSYYSFYKSVILPIPALAYGDSTFIRVFLQEDIDLPYADYLPVYNSYYWGNEGDCQFTVKAEFKLPDVEKVAKDQGLIGGKDPLLKDTYAYDKSGVYTFTAISPPCEDVFPFMGKVTN